MNHDPITTLSSSRSGLIANAGWRPPAVGAIRLLGLLLIAAAFALTCSSPASAQIRARLIREQDKKSDFYYADCVVSPDNKLVAARDHSTGSIDVFDATSGQRLRTIPIDRDRVDLGRELAFLPDGKTLATTIQPDEKSGSVACLIDASTGEVVHRFAEGTTPLAVSADGKYLAASGKKDGTTVVIFDLAAKAKLRTLEVGDEISTFTFVPGRPVLAVARDAVPESVTLWDAETGEKVGGSRGFAKATKEIASSPDGMLLATWDSDRKVKLWDAKTLQVTATFPESFAANRLRFSPDGQVLASSDETQHIKLWQVSNRKSLGTLSGPNCYSVEFSPDGQTIAASNYGKATLWDWRSIFRTIAPGKTLAVETDRERWVPPKFSQDGSVIGSIHHSYTNRETLVVFWDAKTWAARPAIKPLSKDGQPIDQLKFLAFPPKSNLVTAFNSELMLFWDIPTRKAYRPIEGEWRYDDFAFSADGRRFARYTSKGLAIADLGGKIPPIVLTMDNTRTPAFSPDGQKLACGFVMYDLETRQELFRAPSPDQSGIRFTPDGKKVVGYERSVVGVWDLESGTVVYPFTKYASSASSADIRCLDLSDDGRLLATANDYGQAEVWDFRTGRLLVNLAKETNGRYNSIDIAPDGKTIVTQDLKGIQVWDISSLSEGLSKEDRPAPAAEKAMPTRKVFRTEGGGEVVVSFDQAVSDEAVRAALEQALARLPAKAGAK